MPSTPTLAELIGDAIAAKLAEVHVGMPGRVTKYDADRNTVDVRPQFRRSIPNEDGTYTEEDYPVIPDVPVKWPLGNGGSCFITWPLAANDIGELFFNTKDLGQWRSTGAPGTTGDQRTHGLAGATFTPCGLGQNGALLGSSKRHASKVVIGDGVLLGASTAAQAMLKGTVYRSAVTTLMTAWGTFLTALDTYIKIPTPSGGETSTWTAALVAMQAAVTAFEAASATHLSTKHSLDS